MNRPEMIQFVLLRTLGNFLVLFSLYGIIATFGPALYHEVKFKIIEARGVTFEVANKEACHSCEEDSSLGGNPEEENVDPRVKPEDDINSVSFADILAGNKEQVLVPADSQFSIVIPKLGASAKVYPNIDPSNDTEFLPVLQKGIAHAKGSVFPGMSGNVYLFAHSTDNWWHVGRYNALFYLLKDLSVGDTIIVFFEDVRYEYVVSKKVITEPTDVSFIANDHLSSEQLVLQTCWPPGTTWKRLYVVATPKRTN